MCECIQTYAYMQEYVLHYVGDWARLGSTSAPLREPFGLALGTRWARFGDTVGSLRDAQGTLRARFGDTLGSLWNTLGSLWECFGDMFAHFGAILRTSPVHTYA